MDRKKTLLFLLAAAAMAPAAQAQIAAGIALTGQNLTQYYTPGQSKWIYGPTISLQDEHGHVLKLGGDLRASFLRRDGVGVNSFAIGPRASVKLPAVPIRPYAEVLVHHPRRVPVRLRRRPDGAAACGLAAARVQPRRGRQLVRGQARPVEHRADLSLLLKFCLTAYEDLLRAHGVDPYVAVDQLRNVQVHGDAR